MKKKYYFTTLLILAVVFTSGCPYQPTLPPHITIYCNINRDFLISNNLLPDTTNLFSYYYGKENETLGVSIDAEEHGFLGFNSPPYNSSLVNETKFYFLSNFCKIYFARREFFEGRLSGQA